MKECLTHGFPMTQEHAFNHDPPVQFTILPGEQKLQSWLHTSIRGSAGCSNIHHNIPIATELC